MLGAEKKNTAQDQHIPFLLTPRCIRENFRSDSSSDAKQYHRETNKSGSHTPGKQSALIDALIAM